MFTGLIEDIGELVGLQRHAKGAKVTVRCQLPIHEVRIGDSIAVDGACMTVVEMTDAQFTVDVSQESLERTTLGTVKVGTRVHLERALCLGDRLGGHLVQGHVDGVGKKVAQETIGEGWNITWTVPEDLLDTIVLKGSITIDGVSLTVAALEANRVTVAVVPHTGTMTTLTERAVGSMVNIETDLVGKYVRRILTRGAGQDGLTMNALKEAGFA
ncbi:MAG: riboflavin synthase [Myxococcota bacterium]